MLLLSRLVEGETYSWLTLFDIKKTVNDRIIEY
jgi:hypothetical protein